MLYGNKQFDFTSILHCNLDMKYKRNIGAEILSLKSSILLLGPRQTGKSTLIKDLKPALEINLANERTFIEFSSDPGLLESLLLGAEKQIKTIFIDEIQRLPSLLNTIQHLIDSDPKKYRFFLTGSSARKLRRGSANLLPGRIVSLEMTPLTLDEIDYKYNLNSVLSYGLLPGIFTMKNTREKELILSTYGAVYLKEEVQAEALTKNIEGFSRFIFAVAAKNGEFLDFAKLGSQANITQKTATRFFEILEDSLIVFRLNSYSKDTLRRLVKHPKFYFFDVGVLNSLLGSYTISQDKLGGCFESFVISAIRNFLISKGVSFNLSTYRSTGGAEVDLILELKGKEYAIEIKASKNIGVSDLRGLKSFSEISKTNPTKMIIYLGEQTRKIEDVTALPLNAAIQKLEKLCR